jgi:hypothetical protein
MHKPYLVNVGVSATGPRGMTKLRTDGSGVVRVGPLDGHNWKIEIDGIELRRAAQAAVGPNDPQQGEVQVVIGIGPVRADAVKYNFFEAWPLRSVPPSIKASLRVGRDGNLMDVDGEPDRRAHRAPPPTPLAVSRRSMPEP